MTIASTSGRSLSITTLVLRAYQRAGLMGPEQGTSGPTWTPRFSMAVDFLQSIVDQLATEGTFARAVSFTNLTLVSGTYIYELPAGVFDVIGDGSYIEASETDITKASAETLVAQKDRETWQGITAKDATSVPTFFFVDRTVDPVQVYLWPIPDEAGTIRFQTQRILADTKPGTATVDLERFWTEFLIWELAHQLAISANKLPHGQYCSQQAAMHKERAKAQSNQSVASQIVLTHRTAWN